MGEPVADNSGEMLLCDERGPEFSRSLIVRVGGKPQVVFNENPDAYVACESS